MLRQGRGSRGKIHRGARAHSRLRESLRRDARVNRRARVGRQKFRQLGQREADDLLVSHDEIIRLGLLTD